MKRILIPGTCGALMISMLLSTIYTFSVPKIEGGDHALSSWQGKKVLVITLPIQQSPSADSLLISLDSLANAQINELRIIAVPAIEDGFTSTIKASLQQWYRSKLGASIIITDGLYTRRSSGGQQHALFSWLTHESQNEHFDIDVTGPGCKYFAKANGELVGVLKPQTRLSGAAMNMLLQLQ